MNKASFILPTRNVEKYIGSLLESIFSQELKIEACHFAKCRWKEIPIKYYPRSGRAKLGGWKVGFGNLFHLIKKRIIR